MDAPLPHCPAGSADHPERTARRARRRRVLAGWAVLAVAWHLWLLDAASERPAGSRLAPAPAAAVLTVRTVVPPVGPAGATEVEAWEAASAAPEAGPAVVAMPRRTGPPRQAPIGRAPSAPVREASARMTSDRKDASAIEALADANRPDDALRTPATFLTPGEAAPPLYRTELPAAATLRYEARRGPLRGEGELRWQPSGDRYRLALEARLDGSPPLALASEGTTAADGLRPERFVQSTGRAAHAATLDREKGTVSYSGPSTEWPLLPGTQDLLSWMIQLPAIVAADPALAAPGATIALVVVDGRGRAAVRTARALGADTAETAGGPVAAVRFLVPGRAIGDGTYEVWLDPARGHLPVRAIQRDGRGEVRLDLLLRGVETGG